MNIYFFFAYLDQLKDGREKKRCKKREKKRYKKREQLVN
jgi:hypothetical protein